MIRRPVLNQNLLHTTSWLGVNTGDGFKRTTNLPSRTLCTACGWAIKRNTSPTNGQNIFSLEVVASSTEAWCIFVSDGSGTLGITSGSSSTNFASSPAQDQPFFWAVQSQVAGSSIFGYWKYPTSRTFNSVSILAGVTSAIDALGVGNFAYTGANNFSGQLWNVRVWNEVLSERDLMLESLSGTPVRIRDLDSWFLMESTKNEQGFDYGPRGRHLSYLGGVTKGWDLNPGWFQYPIRYVPVAAAAAASFDAALMPAITSRGAFRPSIATKVSKSGMVPANLVNR